ncbi:MAG: hypothetical protein K1Y36_26210 [Blastocatellia bacterium]|nr:hypothetical protein [Blastocatellia bacterium]
MEEGQELLKLPVIRPMEETEHGYNVIFLPGPNSVGEAGRQEIEIVTRLSFDQIDGIIQAGVPLPLARTVDEQDATLIRQRLQSSGVETQIVSDLELQTGAPRRVRKLHLEDGQLHLWSSELLPLAKVAVTDICILVFGSIRTRHVQVTEANKLYGRGREVKDINERYSDELIIDLLGPSLTDHYRIRPDSFDYTCLKGRMRMLAGENFKELGGWLQELMPQAVVIQDFRKWTRMMEPIWPLSTVTERQPLKRIGVGKIATEAFLIIDNLSQFTRFGRLQFLLHQRGLLL